VTANDPGRPGTAREQPESGAAGPQPAPAAPAAPATPTAPAAPAAPPTPTAPATPAPATPTAPIAAPQGPAGRILGIDLGERRIGLAIADGGGLTARPLATINRAASKHPDDDAATLARFVAEQRVVELVVGLPLEANGQEGPMAVGAAAWAHAIAERLSLPVTLRDERLSSHVAESRLGPMPRGRSGGPPSRTQRDRYREKVDREAAAVILQDELDARRETGPLNG
jgi:putative holliday junction resolvase